MIKIYNICHIVTYRIKLASLLLVLFIISSKYIKINNICVEFTVFNTKTDAIYYLIYISNTYLYTLCIICWWYTLYNIISRHTSNVYKYNSILLTLFIWNLCNSRDHWQLYAINFMSVSCMSAVKHFSMVPYNWSLV